MSINKRLSEVFESSEIIPLNDSSKFILFSDCHRGDNSWSDDFSHNQNVFFHALQYYYNKGFSYIELGDGDELWENNRFSDIVQAHKNIFWLMRNFHNDNRFYMIWGNHNINWKKQKNVEKNLYQYHDERENCNKPLFVDIKVHEGIILEHSTFCKKLFLTHGHQGDLMCDYLHGLSKFLVRHLWKHLQLLGFKDPTSPAKNNKKRVKIEKEIIDWAKINNQIIITGHTHRPRFPNEGKPLFFNAGSCVHPRCITGIEIQNDKITLIKWWIKPNDYGALYVTREILSGPMKLKDL